MLINVVAHLLFHRYPLSFFYNLGVLKIKKIKLSLNFKKKSKFSDIYIENSLNECLLRHFQNK